MKAWASRFALTSTGVAIALAAMGACSSDGPAAPRAGASDAASADSARANDAATATESSTGSDAKVDAGSCKLVKPYSTKDKTCNECAAAECCPALNACLGDVECDDHYVNCILGCALLPDDAGPDAAQSGGIRDCEAKCGTSYPAGRAAYDAAIGCVDQRCAVACGS